MIIPVTHIANNNPSASMSLTTTPHAIMWVTGNIILQHMEVVYRYTQGCPAISAGQRVVSFSSAASKSDLLHNGCSTDLIAPETGDSPHCLRQLSPDHTPHDLQEVSRFQSRTDSGYPGKDRRGSFSIIELLTTKTPSLIGFAERTGEMSERKASEALRCYPDSSGGGEDQIIQKESGLDRQGDRRREGGAGVGSLLTPPHSSCLLNALTQQVGYLYSHLKGILTPRHLLTAVLTRSSRCTQPEGPLFQLPTTSLLQGEIYAPATPGENTPSAHHPLISLLQV